MGLWDPDPNSEAGRRLEQERQEVWSNRWAMFRPPPGVRRNPWFYVDILTLMLSIAVGYPLGMLVTTALTGQGALGGVVGIFVTMLVFGFIHRRIQLRGERGEQAETLAPAPARSPGRTLLGYTVGGAVVMALLGVWFAISEGDIDPVTAAVRFAAIGAVPGFLLGLVVAWRRRR